MNEQTSPQPGAQREAVDSTGVGALLRASRQRVGEELRDVAAMLRIRYPYLEAIEEGRYAALPGQTYAVGFVRAYADHLGLDSEEVVRRYKAEIASGGARHDLHFPTPMAETGIPGGAIVFVGLVLAVLVYGGWYLSTAEDGFLSDLVAPLPERLAALVSGDGAPKNPTADKPAETKPVPATSEPAAAEPASSSAPGDSKPDPASGPASEPATAEPPTPPGTESAQPAGSAPESATETMPASTDTGTAVVAEKKSDPATAVAEPASPPAAVEKPVEPAPKPAAMAAKQAQKPAIAAPKPKPSPAAETGAATTAAEPAAQLRTATQASANVETRAQTGGAASTPAAQPASEAQTGAASTTETAATSAPEPASQPASEPAKPKPSRIVVKAKANCYIEIRDDFSNTLLVSTFLHAGDVYNVPDKSGLSLHAGNAGALEITVDGSVVPSIGGDGAVQRGVQLMPELLKAGTAAQ